MKPIIHSRWKPLPGTPAIGIALFALALSHAWASDFAKEVSAARSNIAHPAGLRVQGGYAFVDATVNGAGPFRMLIDTGTDSCALTPRAAQTAGLHYDARVTMMTVTGNSTVKVSSKNEVRIGGSTRAKVEFAISSLEGVRQVDDRVEGVIGQSFLRQAPYLIDYRSKQIWLDDDAVRQGDALGSVVASESNSRETVVPVAIGPEKAMRRLMLDSGSSDLILECTETCPKLSNAELFDVRTNQGVGHVQRGVLAAIEVGGTILIGRPAAVRSPAGSEYDGLLPASWFAAVYVDSSRNIVRFRMK